MLKIDDNLNEAKASESSISGQATNLGGLTRPKEQDCASILFEIDIKAARIFKAAMHERFGGKLLWELILDYSGSWKI